VRTVALFRNVNQGQRGHPSTTDLLGALHDAGSGEAVAFRSNGTIVFDADAPSEVASRAVEALTARTGLTRECFTISMDELGRIVDAHAGEPDAERRELTLHRGGTIDIDDPAVVQEASRRRCVIVASSDGWTVSVNERERESNATPVIERITAAPATSRSLGTLVRVVDRFARPD